ncbi:hypothetical protein ABEB36_013944 [Hypothenemus hampei]|uniref:Uncharacterized protein n=1 Tax=Hypothenemus hampei TaxID=57062 RepID=A0ABD1E641_HYPHA
MCTQRFNAKLSKNPDSDSDISDGRKTRKGQYCTLDPPKLNDFILPESAIKKDKFLQFKNNQIEERFEYEGVNVNRLSHDDEAENLLLNEVAENVEVTGRGNLYDREGNGMNERKKYVVY